MNDGIFHEDNAHCERVVSAKVGDLGGRLSELLSGCVTEACVKDESNALEVLLAGIETQFQEEHAALVDAINAHTAATNAQTSLLEALCGEVKAMNEKMDVLCSRTDRLGHIEGGVAAISKSVQGVVDGTDPVSSFVTGLDECVDDFQLGCWAQGQSGQEGWRQ